MGSSGVEDPGRVVGIKGIDVPDSIIIDIDK